MAPPDNDLLTRLAACETDLAAHRGYLKALEYGLRAAIVSHPDRSLLSRTWASLLPTIAEVHAAEDGPTFTAAFQQCLSVLTRQIEGQQSEPGP